MGDYVTKTNVLSALARFKENTDALYETKADATSYKATADAEIQNNSQRITNIENALAGTVIQEHVDNTQKNVKTILSADELLPWAILKRVGARSTQFNQLCLNGNFSNGTSGWNYPTTTATVSDNILHTVATTAGHKQLFRKLPVIAGHKYLACGDMKSSRTFSSAEMSFYLFTSITSQVSLEYSVANVWQSYSVILEAGDTRNDAEFNMYFSTTVAVDETIDYRNFMLIDITAMGLDSLTADQFRALFLASYYPFNAGDIYDVPPLSFLYRGTNQWDEQYTFTGINATTGVVGTWIDRLTSKNFISATPSTTYSFQCLITPVTFYIHCYDINENWLGVAITPNGLGYLNSDEAFTTLTRTAYIKFASANSNYGTTYNHDIMICLNSVTDKTYKPFIGQTIDTSFMAGKKYVNSSCYDYAEDVYVNGILKRKNQTVVGVVDLSEVAFSYYSTWGCWRIATPSDFKIPSSNADIPNAMCSSYQVVARNNFGDGTIAYSDSYLVVNNGSSTTPPSGILYYELATLPDPTYGDPIPNFPCEDGSTIMANTPQTDIVNAIDVPSTIGYSTKIA